jgi:hypothetical protein
MERTSRSRASLVTTALLIAGIAAACLLPIATAQQLNSERIEQTFGSYGIDVVYANDGLRISNLWGSIGAVFMASGWDVIKTRHSYFRSGLPLAVFDAMGLTEDTAIAAHYYQLEDARDGREIDYAPIIEIHHPDYLVEADLEAIYGPEEIVGMLESARRLYESAMERFTRYGLVLTRD